MPELVVILPQGPSRDKAIEFVGRCLINGLDIYFEGDDELPATLPTDLEGVRAIVFDDSSDIDKATLARYVTQGARVYQLKTEFDITQPTERRYWELAWLQDMLAMDANLTPHHEGFARRMQQRHEAYLVDSLGRELLKHVETRWCEPARHQWEAMLDGYEVTGQSHYLDTVVQQVETALQEENEADNCDAIAPLRALMRLYEHNGDERLLVHAGQTADRYIDTAPRHHGCFVGFHWLNNHARAEIIFQVCPSLMYLYKVSGDARYLDISIDQYARYEKLLSDPATGLWFHGVGAMHQTAAFWSRGVAFVLLGITQIAEYVPEDHEARPAMLETVHRMAHVLRDHQHPSGFWHKVIDEPSTQRESSGTAWIGCALERGVRLGWLDSSYRDAVDRAWGAVKTRIFQGRFPGTVGATTVSADRGYYLGLPMNPKGWPHFAFKFACERRRTRACCHVE